MIGIYKYTNKVNGKVYIGQSNNIQRRIIEHNSRANNPSNDEYQSILSKAIRKYGIENFDIAVLCECSTDALDTLEKQYIAEYRSHLPQYGYNCTLGGESSGKRTISLTELEQLTWDLMNTDIPQKDLALKYNVTPQTISDINVGKYSVRDIEYPIRKRKRKIKIANCIVCGTKITYGHKYCNKCSHTLQQKCERPEPKQLAQEIIESSFSAVGKKYGVSDNAIRKWCVAYGIPKTKKELQQ